MSDSGSALTKDSRGFIFCDGVRLPVRQVAGALEFAIKHPGDQKRLGCKRLRVSIDQFQALERKPPARRTRGPTRREFRAME